MRVLTVCPTGGVKKYNRFDIYDSNRLNLNAFYVSCSLDPW